MKLYVDLETLQLIEGPGFRNPINLLRFKRGDAALLEVTFLAGGSTAAPIGNSNELEIRFGVKPRNRYDMGYLVEEANWTMPASNAEIPVYRCFPSFNTVELNSALGVGSSTGSELSEITLMGEITWRKSGGEPTSTRTFLVIVENDVNRGTEGVPQAAEPAYPAPESIELVTRKGAANGYAGLGPNGKVPVSQLPPLVPLPSPSLGELHALNQGGTAWKGLNQGQLFTINHPQEYTTYPLPPSFRGLTTYRLTLGYALSSYSLADLILQMQAHHGSQWEALVSSETPFGAPGHQFHVVNASDQRVIVGVGYAFPAMKTMIGGISSGAGEIWLVPYGTASLRFLSSTEVSVCGDLLASGIPPGGGGYNYGSY